MSTLISADNTWMLFSILVVIAAVCIRLEQRFAWAAKMSACVLCLVFAMVLANLHVIPTEAAAYDFIWSYLVPLAIPFLLFQADFRKIWRESGRMFGIYLLSSLGTAAGGILAYILLKNVIGPVPSKQALAMFVGTYVGGSVNLVAMADAAKAGKNLVSAAIVADNLLMVLYFFLLSALPASGWILAHYRHPIIDRRRKIESSPEEMAEVKKHHQSHKSRAAEYWKARPVSLSDLATGFAAACMIVAVSKMLAGFFDTSIAGDGFLLSLLRGLLGNQYLLITTITTALATFFPQFFGSISGAQEIGTFLIHIFFAVIGAPASVELIIREAPLLLLFAAIIVLMNLVFSLVFGKVFGYSIEEITVASNANIGGPTTAAAFAIAKGWHTLIFPAILVGTLGYVIGNYYGIFLFTSLK
ncbi:MAG: DUF819 domain-containing protein [Lachnospiraceae bacterium]|nr:DUF819 domain-containing protein [Lachnospiraceae bacterium]